MVMDLIVTMISFDECIRLFIGRWAKIFRIVRDLHPNRFHSEFIYIPNNGVLSFESDGNRNDPLWCSGQTPTND